MPPRRKGTITTKEIKVTISSEVIKGTIYTEEIGKVDDNVPNQDDPLRFAAAVKHRGRKFATSAKEKVEADNVDVPSTEISIRSSKQKALHKILSMDKEDADDASALKPSLGETENDCSGVAAGGKHNNRKKQGPRAKKALKSIPEDVAMEANFAEQGSKIVLDEVKEISELCANEEKPDRGQSRSARAKGNDQCKLRTELEEEQQEKEPQQGKMVTCHKASRKRGGSIKAPGNLSKKTTDCLSMPAAKPDSLSALMSCTQEPTMPESKKDQTLNVRSSTRTKKAVYYNEQTPESENKVFVTAESKAQCANKRNDSAANLRPGGEKRMKKNPTSASEETLALDSARATCVKRGRRRQKLSSPQNLIDKNSAAFINPRETGNKEECREHKKESNSEQVNSSSTFNCVDLDNAVLLQTAQLESVKFSPAQEGVTSMEKRSNVGSIIIMHGKRESDHIAHNTSLSEKSQDQIMSGEWTSLGMLPIAAGKSVVQHSISDRKKIYTAKGRKVNSKQKDTTQKAEGDLLDVLPLESDAEAKSKVSEALLAQGTANSSADAEPEEMCVSHLSIDAARKFNCESQNAGKKTFMKKRTLQGPAQQAKKQKISVLDTNLPATSLDMLVEGAVPAQNQEHEKVIQGVESQGWNAVDITNSERRVERSSEKKRREEIKRKRAMKFDALPVGFGLGISCWSTPPWANQIIEEGGVEVVDSSVMGFRVQSESLMEDTTKQLYLQETAMSNDVTNTSLGLEGTHHALQCTATEEGVEVMDCSIMGFQKSPVEEARKQLCLQETAMSKDGTNTSLGLEDTYHAHPCSATTMQAGNFSESDAQRLPGSGMPKNDLNHRQEKAKVKRQVARKTKTSKALLLDSIPAVHTSSDNSINPVPEAERLPGSGMPKNDLNHQEEKAQVKRQVAQKTKTLLLESIPAGHTNSANSILDKENLEPKLHVHDDDESEFKMKRSSRRRIATAGKEKTTRTRKN